MADTMTDSFGYVEMNAIFICFFFFFFFCILCQRTKPQGKDRSMKRGKYPRVKCVSYWNRRLSFFFTFLFPSFFCFVLFLYFYFNFWLLLLLFSLLDCMLVTLFTHTFSHSLSYTFKYKHSWVQQIICIHFTL